MNFIKNCLLHCLFGVDVQHPPRAVFDLHRPHTLPADVLPESVIETAPKGFVLFSFNDGKNIAFGGFVGSVLCRFKTIRQVLPPVALPMLSKVITLLLTDRHAKFDVFDRELKRSIDLASPCGAA
jgi:hypothetical protein